MIFSCCGSMVGGGGGAYAAGFARYYREGVVRRWDVAGADLWHQSPSSPAKWVWSADFDANLLRHRGLHHIMDWDMGRRQEPQFQRHPREIELWHKVLEAVGGWSAHTERRVQVAEHPTRVDPRVDVIWPPPGSAP